MSHRPPDTMSDIALALHRIIHEQPGIHFRRLGRAARLSSVGQLRHHLDQLRRQGSIVEVTDGRFKRFFAAGEHDPQVRQGLARFARPVPRRIGVLLMNRPMSRTELRRSLDCADSTLGYHLNRMVALGDLVRTRGRNSAIYSLADPEFVSEILRHQPQPPPAAQRPASEPERRIGEPVPPPHIRPALHDERPRQPFAGAPGESRAAEEDRPGRGMYLRDAGSHEEQRPSPPSDAKDGSSDEPDDDDDDDRTRSRPAARVEVRPKKPAGILPWHGRS